MGATDSHDGCAPQPSRLEAMAQVDASRVGPDKAALPGSGAALPAATHSFLRSETDRRISRYPASHFDPPKRDAYDIVDNLPSASGDWSTATPNMLRVQHAEDDGDHKSDEEKGLLDPEAQAGMTTAEVGGTGHTKGGVLQTWRQNKRALLLRVFCVAATLFAIGGLIAATILNKGNETQSTQSGLLTDPLIL